ncbi:MAG: hypothetical protein HY677_05335 [Chloroflexi bacterium]|nr:hypothetical protein [Chloroflexota bacterium]
MVSRLKQWRRVALGTVVMACVAAPVIVFALVASASDGQQVYRATEFVVSAGPGVQDKAAVSGNWMVWSLLPGGFYSGAESELRARELPTGSEIVLTTGYGSLDADIWGETVVWAAGDSIMAYDLARREKAILSNSIMPSSPKVSDKLVAWRSYPSLSKGEIHVLDLENRQEFLVATGSVHGLDVSGNSVVWSDGGSSLGGDIYYWDVNARVKTRLSATTELVTPPAISGNRVVWVAHRGDVWQLLLRDVTQDGIRGVATFAGDYVSAGVNVDIDGDIVVWSAKGATDYDIFGYDLAKGQRFIVDRAVGDQRSPRISGRRVVWTDTRNSGVGKYDGDYSVYGALLEDGPAPPPPATGVPEAADARIEIVWPYDKPVTEADIANIEAVLFQPGAFVLPACQWSPKVQLWRALNNDPARLIASGMRRTDYLGGFATPAWAFNQIDISQAKDPANKIYFFAKTEGTPTRWSVWSHGADGRTYYPTQDTPAGIGSAIGEVEAKIEIVWPYDNAPVSQAKLVNIKAMVFQPGTLLSVPPDWNPAVRLLIGLNNDVLRPVAVGSKRLVQGSGFSYPVWDFNDIDVSQVPASEGNKYFFSLEIDGVGTRPNVWAHGSSGLTYFPLKDTPTTACDRLMP